MIGNKLSKFIVTPSRVASILDWKQIGGAILSLDISNDRIGLALARHPSRSNAVYQLEPISIKRGGGSCRKGIKVDQTVLSKLEEVIQKNKVSAFVVGWPLHPEGRMGAPCGKVLHILDALSQSSNKVVTKNRPLALVDDRDIPRDRDNAESIIQKDEAFPDEWGRSPIFARIPAYSEGVEYRSSEWYKHVTSDDSTFAANLLKSFVEQNWEVEDGETEIELLREDATIHENDASECEVIPCSRRKKTTVARGVSFTDEQEDDKTYISTSLL